MRIKKPVFVILLLLLVFIIPFTFFACDNNSSEMESPIQSIVITTLPKTEYYVGDAFSVGEAKITVYYENGKTETVPLTLNMLSDFDSNSLGEQVLTVFYKNKTTYLTVNVNVAPVYSIQVNSMPEKTTYVIGQELDLTGLRILVTYSNSYTSVIDVEEDMVKAFSTDNEGETQMSIEYGGKFCNVPYSVVKKSADAVEFYPTESFQNSYVVGDAFDLTGGSLFVHYNDNTSEYLDCVELYQKGELTYIIDKESNNVFTTNAWDRIIYFYYNGGRYQTTVSVTSLSPERIVVISDVADQILDSDTHDFSDGQIYVLYNSKQTGYIARVKDDTTSARRDYVNGKWDTAYSNYFVLSDGVYVQATAQYSSTASYYHSEEADHSSQYEKRKQYLYVKSGANYVAAPQEYDSTIVYYIPSNVKIYDFDDSANVTLDLTGFDINEITETGEYPIRITVDKFFIDYSVKVVSPSPTVLEIYPSEENVHKDVVTDAYFVYQDEELDIETWKFKVRMNNGKYSVFAGSYETNVSSDMYVGRLFMVNHDVGVYNYEFNFMPSSTNTVLKCTVPIEVRAKAIVSVNSVDPTRLIYSIGDTLDLSGAKVQPLYINGTEGDFIALTADMVYTESDNDSSNVNYRYKDTATGEEVIVPLKKADMTSFTTSSGDKKVYIYYVDSSYDAEYVYCFDIKVIVKAIAISLSEERETKSDYILGEEFSMENWEVLLTYADLTYSTETDFTDSKWTIEGDDFSTLGQHVVVLYYGDKADNVSLRYTCNVHNEIDYLTVNKTFIGYTTEGAVFDVSELVFTAVRENGDREYIPINSLIASATRANIYLPGAHSFVPATFVTADDWDLFHTFFYTKEDNVYSPATGDYDDETDYYVSADNYVDLTFTYASKSVSVSSLVVSRRMQTVSIAVSPQTEYTLSDSVWNLNDLSLQLSFDNNTTAIVKNGSSGTGVYFTHNGSGRYYFTLNGMEYYFELQMSDGTKYMLSDLKTDLENTDDEYVGQSLLFAVYDSIYGKFVTSIELPFYCFYQQIISVHIEIGDATTEVIGGQQKITGVATYTDPTIYLNEGMTLYTISDSEFSFVSDSGVKRFVYDNSSPQRVRKDYVESVFVKIVYADSTVVYKSLTDMAHSAGFSISGYNYNKLGSQTVTMTYLLKTCSVTVYVRANLSDSIYFVDKNENPISEVTVIEGMDIDPGQIDVVVNLKDADGDPLALKRVIDFSDVVCNYDKTQSVTFTSQAYLSGDKTGVHYVVIETDAAEPITITYDGCFRNLRLVIEQKSVEEIVMRTMPQQVYPELPESDWGDAEKNAIDITNGTVMVKYNNGTTEELSLEDARLRINSQQFNRKIVLNSGAQQSQTIVVTFTDKNNKFASTSYNVIVRDRKNLSIVNANGDPLPAQLQYSFQYGTGVELRPQFNVYYYSDFYMNTPVLLGEGNNGFSVNYSYIDPITTLPVLRSIWPTEVGTYTMIVSYDGDEANNSFENSSIIITITKKYIGIDMDDLSLTFGQKLIGTQEEVDLLHVLGINWEMKGLNYNTNYVDIEDKYSFLGSGSAFVGEDTLESVVTVKFNIYKDGTLYVPAKSSQSPYYIIVSLDVGEYDIIPELIIKKSNYTFPEDFYMGKKLTINKMPIKITAVNETKRYGTEDPKFRYNVYDENDNYLGGTYYEEVTSFEVDSSNRKIVTNLYEYDQTTGIYSNAVAYTEGKRYFRLVSVLDLDDIYQDTSLISYRLARRPTDTNNVSDYHEICSTTFAGYLDNYSLLDYVSASLLIQPAEVSITATSCSRPYGTQNMNIVYGVSATSSLCNNNGTYLDTFESVFGNYFSSQSNLYYDTVTKRIYETFPSDMSSYDSLAVLYRNMEIEDFETVLYKGVSYVSVPVALDCGSYTCRMTDVFSNVVSNYVVTTEPFVFTVYPIDVRINIGSVVIFEDCAIVDGNEGKSFINYFDYFAGENSQRDMDFALSNIYGDRLNVNDFVFTVDNRKTIDSMFEDYLRRLILGVEYITGSGDNPPRYLLSSDYLNGFTLTKEIGTDVGKYRVMIGSNYSDNFSSFSLYSHLNTDINFFSYYYSAFIQDFTELGSIASTRGLYNSGDYEEGAYVIIMPGFIDLDYYYTVDSPMQEIYSHKALSAWNLQTDYSIDGLTYTAVDADSRALNYSFSEKPANAESVLAAGNYTIQLSYDYFADYLSDNKFSTNYVYLGELTNLADSKMANILAYVLFGVKNEDLVFTKKGIQYTVLPYEIDVYIEGFSIQYDFMSHPLIIRVDDYLFGDDTLDFIFDYYAEMNSGRIDQNTDRRIYNNYYSKATGYSDGCYIYNTVSGTFTPASGSEQMDFFVFHNGTAIENANIVLSNSARYTITLNSIGNTNYVIGSRSVLINDKIIIEASKLPILLYSADSVPITTTTAFDFSETYTTEQFNPIKSGTSWQEVNEYSDSILFYSISFDKFSDTYITNSTEDHEIGSVKLTESGDSIPLMIHFYKQPSTFTVDSANKRINASGGFSMSTEKNNNDYCFYYVDSNSVQHKVYLDTATKLSGKEDRLKYYYKGDPYKTYKTATCTIVGYYLDENGVRHESAALAASPTTLSIYPDDGQNNGNYPSQVRRDQNTNAVIGYDIVFKDSLPEVNYSVVFVYLEDGQYKVCDDAHKYTVTILPATLTLSQFASNKMNEKVYDGFEASIPQNNTNMVLFGSLAKDPVSVSSVAFEFFRVDEENSTYITIGGTRYYLVDKDDLSCAGVFKVRAYLPENGNYEIRFNKSGSYVDPADELNGTYSYGIYTIKRQNLKLTFNNATSVALSKEYDGYGLLDHNNTYASGYFNSIRELVVGTGNQGVSIPSNEFELSPYLLDMYAYAQTMNGAISTSISAYNVGYYWFNFYGLFVDNAGGYHKYDERTSYATDSLRWLNWNYTFSVNNSDLAVNHSCDGIYKIAGRNLYLAINGQLPQLSNEINYSYFKIYDGKSLTTSEVNSFLDGDVVNLYYYDSVAKEFIPVADSYFASNVKLKPSDTTQQSVSVLPRVGDPASIVNVGESYQLSIDTLVSINNNNIVIKNGNEVYFGIKPYTLDVMVTYTNTNDNNVSGVSYGKTIKENAVNFTLSVSEEEMNKLNSAFDSSYTAIEILEQACGNISQAEFYLYSENDSENIMFKFQVSTDSPAIYVYNSENDYYTEMTDGLYKDGTEYYSRVSVSSIDTTEYYQYYEVYERSNDSTALSDKKYYTFAPTEFTPGVGITADSYFERFESGYVLTADRTFVSGKEYFVATNYTGSTINSNVYQLNKFYFANEDRYFLSGTDYYFFTAKDAYSGLVAETNLPANTYYEYDTTSRRFALTEDKIFSGEKINNGKYYVVQKANVVTGANAIRKYYVLSAPDVSQGETDNKWVRTPDTTAQPGVKYYMFVPTTYSENETISEYLYYYRNGSFYKVTEEISAGTNYYVAYISDRANGQNISYYTKHDAIHAATGAIDENYDYYKLVRMTTDADAGTYFRLNRLLPQTDYTYGGSIGAKVVYESVNGSDTLFRTADEVFAIGKNYYELISVTDELVAGEDVTDYYVLKDGYSQSTTTLIDTDDTYYRLVELAPGVDYTVNALIPANTYYEKVENENRYSITDDLYFAAGTTYYLFEAVKALAQNESLNDLFTLNYDFENSRVIYKRLIALTAGVDYINSSIIGDNDKYSQVYYYYGDRYVPADPTEKFKPSVQYVIFVDADGFIRNAELLSEHSGEYYVSASDTYFVREKVVSSDDIGDPIAGNVIKVDTFEQTTDTQYMSGKAYFIYTSEGYVRQGMADSYARPASDYYKMKLVENVPTADGRVNGDYYYYNSSIHRYLSANGQEYDGGKQYFRAEQLTGYVKENELNSSEYCVSGSGYYSIFEYDGTGDSFDLYYISDIDYVELAEHTSSVRLIPEESSILDPNKTYYRLNNAGFVRYTELDYFYISGSGYYSAESFVATDNSLISSNNIYTYTTDHNRYERATGSYVSGNTYFIMDNSGYVPYVNRENYVVSGSNYYTFVGLSNPTGTISGEVYIGDGNGYLLETAGSYQPATEYYRAINGGLVFLGTSSDPNTFYLSTENTKSFVLQIAGVDYTVGEGINEGQFYVCDSFGRFRLTAPGATFSSDLAYYKVQNVPYAFVSTDDISDYYISDANLFSIVLLKEGTDYTVFAPITSNVYEAADSWYKHTAGSYTANTMYLSFATINGYIRYYNGYTQGYKYVDGKYKAVSVSDYVIGDTIPNNTYYRMLPDGRLVYATGQYQMDENYYTVSTGGFVYGADESELYLLASSSPNSNYYSFVEKDVESLIGTIVGSTEVYRVESDGRMVRAASSETYSSDYTYFTKTNAGYILSSNIGEYFISSTGYYSIKETVFSSSAYVYYVYLKNNEFVKTSDTVASNVVYYTFSDGGFIQNNKKSQYYRKSDVFRTDKTIYEYYNYGDILSYDEDDSVSGKIYEYIDDAYVVTEDKYFYHGKEYYSFIPKTVFFDLIEPNSNVENGLYVYQSGYIRASESYVEADLYNGNLDYTALENGKFYTFNKDSVPYAVAQSSTISDVTDYYRQNDYYGIFKHENTTGANVNGYYEYKDGIYVETIDEIGLEGKDYYSFRLDSGLAILEPIKYYELKNGEFVLSEDEVVLSDKTYYYFKNYPLLAKKTLEYTHRDSSQLENGQPVPEGMYTYDSVAGKYVSAYGKIFDTTNNEYYSRTINSFSYFTGGDSFLYYDDEFGNRKQLPSGNYYATAKMNSTANFELNIIATPFVIEKQEIVITGVERQYYDQVASNYEFVLSEETEVNAGVKSLLKDAQKGLYLQIEDHSNLYDDAGSYYTNTVSTKKYYVSINKSVIDEYNDNPENDYKIVLQGVNVSNGESGKIYLPLFITRMQVEISIDLTENDRKIEYGIKPDVDTDLIAQVKFSDYRAIPSGANQDAYNKQQAFLNAAKDKSNINYVEISDIISRTAYTGMMSSISLQYYLLRNLVDINAGFTNYYLSLGEVTYTIEKRVIDINVTVRKSLYDPNQSINQRDNYHPFTILYSQKDSLVYNESSMDPSNLEYGLSIDDFESAGVVYDHNNLKTQMMEIVTGLTETGGILTLNDESFTSIQDFLNRKTQYTIVNGADSEDVMAGLNYVCLKEGNWYESNNYILRSAKTDIILYPEINSLGEHKNGDAYLNLIADTEAIVPDSGATINSDTKMISNLAFILRLNMDGMKTSSVDYSTQYYDTLDFSTYDYTYYDGQGYSRTLELYYLSGASGNNVINVGDVVTVYAVVRETFATLGEGGTRLVSTIESNRFRIRVVNKQIINTDGTTVSSAELKSISGTLDLSGNVSGAYDLECTSFGSYDSVGLRVRLTPVTDAAAYDFSTVVFKNAVGELSFGAVGGLDKYVASLYNDDELKNTRSLYYYVRYLTYGIDYYYLSNHKTAQKNVQYYSCSAGIFGKDIVSVGNYYVKKNNVLYLASAPYSADILYYTVTALNLSVGATVPNNSYMNCNEDVISSENLPDLFDGRSHYLQFYLDRVGHLQNIEVSNMRKDIKNSFYYTYNTGYVSDTNYYTYQAVTNLTPGTPLIEFDNNNFYTTSYYILENGNFVMPYTYYAESGVTYYTITLDSTVNSSTLTANHLKIVEITDTNQHEYRYSITNETITAERNYYFYFTIDGEVNYSDSSLGATTKAILSYQGGIYVHEDSYFSDITNAGRGIWDRAVAIKRDVTLFSTLAGQQQRGTTLITYTNVRPIISSYFIKNEYATALQYVDASTTRLLLRAITLFPTQFTDTSSAYLVSESAAAYITDTTKNIAGSILYYATFGSSDNTLAYNNPSAPARTKVRFGDAQCRLITGTGETSIMDVVSGGLYVLRMPIVFEYGSGSQYQKSWTYKMLIAGTKTSAQTVFAEYRYVENKMNEVKAGDNEVLYKPSASSPVTLAAGDGDMKYYFNHDAITEQNRNSSTIIFDLKYSETIFSGMWIYLGLSERELYDLTSNMLSDDGSHDFWSSAGIGININHSLGGNTSTRVYGSIYVPTYLEASGTYQPGIQYFIMENGQYVLYPETQYTVGARINNTTTQKYIIDKSTIEGKNTIYASTEYDDIDWTRGRNILQVDYINVAGDAIISIRLYQYYFNTVKNQYVTDFVWQEYFRSGFTLSNDEDKTPINKSKISRLVNNIKYVGFQVSSLSVNLYSYTTSTSDIYEFDLNKTSLETKGFKYYRDSGVQSNTDVSDEYVEGEFVSGHSEITNIMEPNGEFLQFMTNSVGEYYIFADQYNVPHAYTGNTVSMTFTLSEGAYGYKNFLWYFGSSTPYIGNFAAVTYLRERGMAVLSYNNGGQYDYFFEFYKYGKEYLRQPLNLPTGFTGFDDGKEHTIKVRLKEYVSAVDSAIISRFSSTQTLELANNFSEFIDGIGVRGFYLVEVYIDGQLTTCVAPYYNNMKGIRDYGFSQSDDEEFGGASDVPDEYFFQNIYYSGVRSGAIITIKDFFAYME